MPDERDPNEPTFPPPPPPAPPPGYFDTPGAPTPWGAPPPAQTAYPGAPPRWRSLRGLTTALTVLYSAMVGVSLLLLIALIHHRSVFNDERRGEFLLNVRRVNDAGRAARGLAVVVLLLGIALVALFIIWLYRAAKNNEALGRYNPRFSPGWAIGGWFIPFANLVIPLLVIQDVWRGSDASVPRGDPNWRRASGSGIVGGWWAALVVTAVARVAAGAGTNKQGEFEKASDFARGNAFALVSTVAAAAAAVLALVVVRSLATRQEACLRAQQTAAAGPS